MVNFINMTFTNINIEFEIEGKTIKGDCTIIKIPGKTEFPYKFPLYRVALNRHLIKPNIFLYYEINKPKNRFYWFKNPEPKKESLYKAICLVLEKEVKPIS